jgi:sulfide:quinone oxidoreductase
MFVYPISIWITTNRLPFKKATISLDKLATKYGFRLIVDEFIGLNANENKVILKNRELSYDYLVMASGAAKVVHPGIENTLSICGNPDQSVKIRERFNTLAQKGGNIAIGFGGNPKDQSAVRGGPAFELMFNLMHELKRRKNKQKVTFSFFSPMPEPGRRMGEKGYKLLLKMLKQYGIERRVGKKIKQFEPDGIIFEDDSRLNSDLTLFIPAGAGPGYLAKTQLPLNEAGFIKINEHCKVKELKIFMQ